MPKFVIERQYLVPMFQHIVVEVDTFDEACKLAVSDDIDWDTSGSAWTRASGSSSLLTSSSAPWQRLWRVVSWHWTALRRQRSGRGKTALGALSPVQTHRRHDYRLRNTSDAAILAR